MTFTAYCQKLAPQYGVHHLTVAKRIRAGKIPAPPIHRENKRAFYVADGVQDETIPALRAEISELKKLLNESYVFIAIRHKACNPWRIALDDWQARVEKQTGWNAFTEIKNHVGSSENDKADSTANQ